MAVTKAEVLAFLEADEPDYAAAARLGPEALPVLEELLSHDRPDIPPKAASLAGMIGGDQAVAVLRKAGQSADPVVRVAAAGASSNLAPPEAAQVLAPLITDADVGVQKTALRAAPAELPGELRAAIEKVEASTSDPGLIALQHEVLGREEPMLGEMPAGEME